MCSNVAREAFGQQRSVDVIDVVQPLRAVRIDDQMHAGAAHAFADRKMAGTILGWLEAPTFEFRRTCRRAGAEDVKAARSRPSGPVDGAHINASPASQAVSRKKAVNARCDKGFRAGRGDDAVEATKFRMNVAGSAIGSDFRPRMRYDSVRAFAIVELGQPRLSVGWLRQGE